MDRRQTFTFQGENITYSYKDGTFVVVVGWLVVQSLMLTTTKEYIASNTFSIIYHSNSTFYSNLPNLDVSSCE